MSGLCNICDEVGAQNWAKFDELVEMLQREINGDHLLTPMTKKSSTRKSVFKIE